MVPLAYQWYQFYHWESQWYYGITIGTNGITNGTIGKTMKDIGIPLVPLRNPGRTQYCSLSQRYKIELSLNIIKMMMFDIATKY